MAAKAKQRALTAKGMLSHGEQNQPWTLSRFRNEMCR